MNILYATSEVSPFMKTGGMADSMGALPKTISELGEDVRVILPLYAGIDESWKRQMSFKLHIYVHLAWRRQYCGLFVLKKDGVTYYFVDNQYYFGRQPIYGYADDAERFAFFSRAIIDILPRLGWRPEVIHCNDWQTALIPIYMRGEQADIYAGIRTVYTIHNIEYQGRFSPNMLWDVFGLPQSVYDSGAIKFEDSINLVKGAINRSDFITTVSPTYAHELRDPYYAWGLHKVIEDNSYKIRGIIRGIDQELYNPATDKKTYCAFTSNTLEGKAFNKSGLQRELSLRIDPDVPVIACVSRLVGYKGLDLLMSAIGEIMSKNVQLVILGTGDWEYEHRLEELGQRYRGSLSVNIVYSETLASRIYAGADMLIMPSRFEPGGQAQMIAMRYGTVPVVRETGGLKDIIIPWPGRNSNGFSFSYYSTEDMLIALNEAISLWRKKPESWREIVHRCMETDFSWELAAREYIKIYKRLAGKYDEFAKSQKKPLQGG